MPEIETKVRQGGDDVEVGKEYEILNVEQVTTEVAFYKGWRVSLLTKKAEEGSVMLWERPVTSPDSKLGAFITLLGGNTDKWLHKWIKFVDWRQGARLIELVK